MSDPMPDGPLEQFVVLIRNATGNLIPPARYGFLEEVAQRRAHARGLGGVADYVRALATHEIDDEWASLIPLITIKESYFFRAPQQFDIIRQEVLPKLLRARAASRSLRIWSAACARGEEPATLAMVLAEEQALAGWEWTIVATDVDEEALSGARLGLYGERSIAQVPPELLQKYFTRRGKLFELDAGLRTTRIHYQKLNLAHPPFALPFSEFDLILLRNVLIYFKRPLQQEVLEQISHLLSRKGFLFLGASETLWQIQDELEAVDLGACFSYRHRRSRPVPEVPLPPPPRVPKPVEVPEERPASLWLDEQHPRDWSVLRGALAGTARAAPASPPPAAPPALSVHDRLLTAARDLEANRIQEAGASIAEALAADPSEPAAHALEGFLHDLCNRAEEAVTSYRAALYLDPSLFQARVLLADCLLRLGHRDRAEHQYREVLTLLGSGRERALTLFTALPLPDRERAQRRCRQVLKGM